MQRISRAPLLSATLRTDSCWIISARLLQNFRHAPARLFRDRAGLDDANAIADTARVLLVMHFEAPRVADDLLVERVRLEGLHHDDDGLLHLVAHDHAVARLAARARGLRLVTHRHPPERRRLPRLPARAPRTRHRERLRVPLRELRDVPPWAHEARARAWLSPAPGERPP